ncbi:hypothetical protein [Roseibium sp. RKSG952]|uniref:hypothetical protein n=1 Tax=Roseibium sp. RKSG952 TaxID=2529384 RepID=UPI0012BCE0C3|nr:hypothetical protein [Roseibium sp. RKSG952]MTH94846.1 hypothetical protein [Roseibium sp. RKSG952]
MAQLIDPKPYETKVGWFAKCRSKLVGKRPPQKYSPADTGDHFTWVRAGISALLVGAICAIALAGFDVLAPYWIFGGLTAGLSMFFVSIYLFRTASMLRRAFVTCLSTCALVFAAGLGAIAVKVDDFHIEIVLDQISIPAMTGLAFILFLALVAALAEIHYQPR